MYFEDVEEILWKYYPVDTLGYDLKNNFTFVQETIKLLRDGMTKEEIIEKYIKKINKKL